MNKLLQQTTLLDYAHPSIQGLVRTRAWTALAERERIGAIYDFVRNEVAFGYNLADDLPASHVLADGIGQCNTKGTLFMALLLAAGIPCRFHGFTIDKALQKGAITGVAYVLAPRSIIHSWVEVWHEGRWVELEGFILDKDYLSKLQERFADREGAFCGFGAATPDLRNPGVEWTGANLSGVKKWLFQGVVRHWMNRNVAKIRGWGGRDGAVRKAEAAWADLGR